MPRMRSCGILLFAEAAGSRYFLLMKHARRYDLPKGHVEKYVRLPHVWTKTFGELTLFFF